MGQGHTHRGHAQAAPKANLTPQHYTQTAAPYRRELLQAWLQRCSDLSIPTSPAFRLAPALASPVELGEWGISGLPSDDVSIDNGVLVAKGGGRWPLMIDPQEQGST